MTAIVFCGPSLPHTEAQAILAADFRAPVTQGDIYRAALQQPRAIGIVDGCFQGTRAVWHKEILWAMAQGIYVFGSASIGALRAAELATFGMIGVGEVFAAYRDGVLEDDDEVAVVHGPAELGYRSCTEALVNIRYTVAAAAAAAVIRPATAERLTAIGKALFYRERTYPALLDKAVASGLPGDELGAFGAWLRTGGVDRKRQDACAMLRVMADLLAASPRPLTVDYDFEHTSAWDEMVRHEAALAAFRERGARLPLEILLKTLDETDYP